MRRLNTLVFVATALYATLDKYLGIEVEFYVYLSFFLFVIINAYLIHQGLLEGSKVFGLVAFNIMIFLVATSEPFATGMHLHYVTSGAVALALYGYEQWKGAIFFVVLALLLDIITFTSGTSFIPYRDVSTEQARVFFVLNTLICASVCVYTFMIYSKINYESQQSLEENESVIKEQNEQLLKANQELDRFVYSASHDLRSPLSTLTGLINLSNIETDEGLKTKYLNLMKERVKSMDSFISEIIDYSRNSRLEVSRKRLNLKRFFEVILEELKYINGSDKVEIQWCVDNGLYIESDETRLKIIFSNLITNVIKYRDEKKSNSYLKIRAQVLDSHLAISIEDNGIGINANYLSHVFDMFYRAHDHSSGSGLGLYIVKETVAKLQGTINVKSTEGLGSVFTVTLPNISISNQIETT